MVGSLHIYKLGKDIMNTENKKIISWSLYDWGNSAYTTTVMAAFFPIFFEKYWSNPDDVIQSTYHLGITASTASLFIAVIAPFIGAIADRGSTKKKFLFFFACIGALTTCALYFVGQGNWQLALLFYVISSIGFMGSNTFYDSLLPSIAKKNRIDFVSSLGFSLGYIGGGLLFLLNVIMYLNPSWFGIVDPSIAIRLSFITVGIWWMVFSVPLLLFVPEPINENSVPFIEAIGEGWNQLKETFYHIKEMKEICYFLLAYWLYIDGVDTIVRMAAKLGSSLGFETSDLITAILMVQFIAFPAALIYNIFAQKIGVKNAIYIAIGGYALITFFAYFMDSRIHFYILASLIGLFQGGIQALSRSLFARLVPKNKDAEFFGFYNMLGKFAAVIGPILVGWMTLITGNVRYGFLSILILFILGAYFFSKVDFERGERIAKEFG